MKKLRFFVLIVGGLIACNLGFSERPETWGRVFARVSESFDRQSAAFIIALTEHDVPRLYTFASGRFRDEMIEADFVRAFNEELFATATGFELAHKELIYTGGVLVEPDRRDGRFYMSSILRYEVNERPHLYPFLWEYDEVSQQWMFLNFSLPQATIPHGLRFIGIPITERPSLPRSQAKPKTSQPSKVEGVNALPLQ